MKLVDVPEERYREIADAIRSADSPVGIDATRTHVMILHKLIEIERRLDRLEHRAAGDSSEPLPGEAPSGKSLPPTR